MAEKELKPAIRFREFNEAWEQRKLGDEATEMVAGGDVNRDLLRDKGAYPVFANALTNEGIIGYYETEYRIKAPAVTVTGRGDVGHAKARNTNFTPIVRLLSIKSNHDVFFLENAINTLRIVVESTGVPQLTVPQLAKYELFFPKEIGEEQQIGTFFRNLDHLITLHQRKYDKLVEIKKSMLEKMFPKNGSVIPEIRLTGFSDAWEQRKLGDVYQKIRNAFVGTATPYYVDAGHFYLESNNVKDGQINRNSEILINNKFYESQRDNWLHAGDLVMVQSGHVGHTAVIPENLDNTAAHALIIIANPIEKICPFFVNYQFQAPRAKDGINNITTGNTIKHVLASEIKKFDIQVPQYNEQKKIGIYFRNLDHLITLHQHKLEKLKNIKKSMLEKMFI